MKEILFSKINNILDKIILVIKNLFSIKYEK